MRREQDQLRTVIEEEGGRCAAALARCSELEGELEECRSRQESSHLSSRDAEDRLRQLGAEVSAASLAQAQQVGRVCTMLAAQVPTAAPSTAMVVGGRDGEEPGDGGVGDSAGAARMQAAMRLRELYVNLDKVASAHAASAAEAAPSDALALTSVAVVHQLRTLNDAQAEVMECLLEVRVRVVRASAARLSGGWAGRAADCAAAGCAWRRMQMRSAAEADLARLAGQNEALVGRVRLLTGQVAAFEATIAECVARARA